MRNQFNVHNNTLYTTSTQNKLASINVNNGKLNWEKTTFRQDKKEKRYKTSGQRLPIVNNMLFAANNDNGISAYNIKNGELIWNYQLQYPFNNYSPAIQGKYLIIQSAPLIYCFDTANGNLLWYKSYGNMPMYLQITMDEKNAFVGDRRNILYALDINTGIEKWKYIASAEFPSISENILLNKKLNQLVFTISEDRNRFSIYAIDPEEGTKLWKT